MQSKFALVGLAAALAQAATPQGFNYGSVRGDNSAYQQSDFESMFKLAQNLPGTSGFSSARLYTMMQGGTTDQVISAIPAAISTKTSLLLGMWTSGQGAFDNEMNVFKSVLSQYGSQIKDLVVGISVGSEDLYRISPTGLSSPNAGPGVEPSDLADYINKVKDSLKGTPLEGTPVGHVDTWTAWVNGSNSAVTNAADFLGVDAYPYWQSTEANGIENGASLFNEAFDNTKGASSGKPVWITETGWPVNGKSSGSATASTDNAQKYWQAVGCPNFGNVPTFWYTMMESPTGDNPDFSIYNAGSSQPYFDLSCSNVQNSTSTSTMKASSTFGTSISTGTGSSSSSGSGASNGTFTSGSPSSPSSTGSGSSSGSGSSGSGSGSSGSGSGTGSSSGAAATNSGPAVGGAASFGAYSVGTPIAVAAGVAALL